MPDNLYDRDILAWSDRQASLLRRLAAGERVNAELDWSNLIEEVEDLGRSELHAVESLLTRVLENLLKIHGWPDAQETQHWHGEIRPFLLDARRRFTPGMARKLALQDLFRDARSAVEGMTLGGRPPRALPDTCPYALADLIVSTPDAPDVDRLLARLGPAPAP